MKPALLAAAVMIAATNSTLAGYDQSFDNGAPGWRVVLDGVMGGRSTGRIASTTPGSLLFSGDLSLENNGGFSQVRTQIPGGAFTGADGITFRVRGDGRTYTFDIRTSDARLMAGSFQKQFTTQAGVWRNVTLEFEDFRLYNFGRLVAGNRTVDPTRIESIGFTLADKNPGPFRLEVDRVFAAGVDALSPTSEPSDDLLAVAQGAGLNTLVELVRVSGIGNALPSGEQITVFAPTDEAFAKIPARTLEKLLQPAQRDTLRAILANHVTTPATNAPALYNQRTLAMLGGQRIAINAGAGLRIGDASLVTVDVPFNGGIIHVIDTVLMPETRSITDLASASPDLSTLLAAVNAAGLADQLGPDNGPFTVFAPVNSAFDALPDGALASLLEPEARDDLVRILGLHVVPGKVYASDALAAGRAATFFAETIDFSITDGQLTVAGARVITPDIEASNGIIHLIDTVILPESAAGSAETAPQRSVASREDCTRLMSLAIERGAPLFNKGDIQACASIYEVAITAMVDLAHDALGSNSRQRLEMALAEADTENSWREKAWIYRRAMDDVFASFSRSRKTGEVAISH